MNKLEELYFNGFLLEKFKNGKCLEQYNGILNQVFNEDIKEGYALKSKYPFSRDLRPQAHDYDNSIIDILFESNIPGLIKKSLGHDLYLAHVQIRVSELFPPGQEERSYMEWHRDTHFYGGELHGNAPPVYKLIYYPELNDVEEKPLAVAPGTHLRILLDEHADRKQLQQNKILAKSTSLNEFLFFNTSMFHSTLPAHKNGTLRIIYNFCLEEQLAKYKEQVELHKIYKERLKERRND